MGKEKRSYLGLVFSISAVVLIFLILKPFAHKSGKIEIRKVSAPILAPAEDAEDAVIYDIDKMRGLNQKEAAVRIDDLAAVYKNYPVEDVGDNMPEAWAKVNPEDKAKLLQGMDAKISEVKEKLKLDPNDKKAKAMLVISESLKNMAANNFNYKKD